MEEKDREFKRARTVRHEYTQDVGEVQSWIQKAELKVQDRSVEPLQLKEYLSQIQSEIGGISDKLERLTKNGQTISEKTRDENESSLVQKTISTLTEQLQQVRAWLEEKKLQVGESLDSWQRFVTLHQAVRTWVDEKQTFLLEPLHLSNLTQARQRLHDYSVAVKSCKQVARNLGDMGKELENISQVASVGDLPEKLEEAEEAKTEVESQILERNALLQETSEEWEQCEKKMKDVRAWIEKSRQSLDSPQHKKRPLRDQLNLREKMISDISIQKTKISISVEKLQVHFRSGVGGDSKVSETAQDIINELDQLMTSIKEQVSDLETSIGQIDQYQQEIQQLRQQMVQVEQQLRNILSPTYSPNNRDKALEDQNGLQRDMGVLRNRIQGLTDHIHHIDPYMVIIPDKNSSGDVPEVDDICERKFLKTSYKSQKDFMSPVTTSVTYADIAAGRTSPCPFSEQIVDDRSDNSKILPVKTAKARLTETKVSKDHETKVSEAVKTIGQNDLEEDSKTNYLISDTIQDCQNIDILPESPIKLHIEEVSEPNPVKLHVEKTEAPIDKSQTIRRSRSPRRREVVNKKVIDHKMPQNAVSDVKLSVHGDIVSSLNKQVLPTSENQTTFKRQQQSILKESLKPEIKRGRSPSPMWNPGSTSYADILRGRQDWNTENYSCRTELTSAQQEFIQPDVLPPPSQAVFEFIQQSPDLVGFIASGQQLLNSGLGTYHSTADQYAVTEQPLEKSGEILEAESAEQKSFQVEPLESEMFAGKHVYIEQGYDVPQDPPVFDKDNSLDDQHLVSDPVETDIHSSENVTHETEKYDETDITVPATLEMDESHKYLMPNIVNNATDIDRCHLSYAQILAQGLYIKPLQPPNRTIVSYQTNSDRSNSPRRSSPNKIFSRERSISPFCEKINTESSEMTKLKMSTGMKIEKDDKKFKDYNKTNAPSDLKGTVSNQPQAMSPSIELKKLGKGKPRKRHLSSNLTSYEKQTDLSDTDVSATEKPGEHVAETSVSTTVPISNPDENISLKNVKESGSNELTEKAQHISQKSPNTSDSQHVKVTATENTECSKRSVTGDESKPSVIEISTAPNEKKKKQKKKKCLKSSSEDEIEKALKEIAEMDSIQIKNKNKKELANENKQEFFRTDKEDKKVNKKLKLNNGDSNSNKIEIEIENESKRSTTTGLPQDKSGTSCEECSNDTKSGSSTKPKRKRMKKLQVTSTQGNILPSNKIDNDMLQTCNQAETISEENISEVDKIMLGQGVVPVSIINSDAVHDDAMINKIGEISKKKSGKKYKRTTTAAIVEVVNPIESNKECSSTAGNISANSLKESAPLEVSIFKPTNLFPSNDIEQHKDTTVKEESTGTLKEVATKAGDPTIMLADVDMHPSPETSDKVKLLNQKKQSKKVKKPKSQNKSPKSDDLGISFQEQKTSEINCCSEKNSKSDFKNDNKLLKQDMTSQLKGDDNLKIKNTIQESHKEITAICEDQEMTSKKGKCMKKIKKKTLQASSISPNVNNKQIRETEHDPVDVKKLEVMPSPGEYQIEESSDEKTHLEGNKPNKMLDEEHYDKVSLFKERILPNVTPAEVDNYSDKMKALVMEEQRVTDVPQLTKVDVPVAGTIESSNSDIANLENENSEFEWQSTTKVKAKSKKPKKLKPSASVSKSEITLETQEFPLVGIYDSTYFSKINEHNETYIKEAEPSVSLLSAIESTHNLSCDVDTKDPDKQGNSKEEETELLTPLESTNIVYLDKSYDTAAKETVESQKILSESNIILDVNIAERLGNNLERDKDKHVTYQTDSTSVDATSNTVIDNKQKYANVINNQSSVNTDVCEIAEVNTECISDTEQRKLSEKSENNMSLLIDLYYSKDESEVDSEITVGSLIEGNNDADDECNNVNQNIVMLNKEKEVINEPLPNLETVSLQEQKRNRHKGNKKGKKIKTQEGKGEVSNDQLGVNEFDILENNKPVKGTKLVDTLQKIHKTDIDFTSEGNASITQSTTKENAGVELSSGKTIERRDTKKKLQRPSTWNVNNPQNILLKTDTTIPSEKLSCVEQELASIVPPMLSNIENIVLTPQWMDRSKCKKPVNEDKIYNQDTPQESYVDQDDDSLLILSASTPSTSAMIQSPASIDSDSGLAEEISPKEDLPSDEVSIFGSVKERSKGPRKIIDLNTVKYVSSPMAETESVTYSFEDTMGIPEDSFKDLKAKMKKKKQRAKIPSEFLNTVSKFPETDEKKNQAETLYNPDIPGYKSGLLPQESIAAAIDTITEHISIVAFDHDNNIDQKLDQLEIINKTDSVVDKTKSEEVGINEFVINSVTNEVITNPTYELTANTNQIDIELKEQIEVPEDNVNQLPGISVSINPIQEQFENILALKKDNQLFIESEIKQSIVTTDKMNISLKEATNISDKNIEDNSRVTLSTMEILSNLEKIPEKSQEGNKSFENETSKEMMHSDLDEPIVFDNTCSDSSNIVKDRLILQGVSKGPEVLAKSNGNEHISSTEKDETIFASFENDLTTGFLNNRIGNNIEDKEKPKGKLDTLSQRGNNASQLNWISECSWLNYYLYSDAEKLWQEKIQRAKIKCVLDLQPSTEKNTEGLEQSSYIDRVDTKETKAKEIISTVKLNKPPTILLNDSPKYNIMELIDAEKQWFEWRSLKAFSCRGDKDEITLPSSNTNKTNHIKESSDCVTQNGTSKKQGEICSVENKVSDQQNINSSMYTNQEKGYFPESEEFTNQEKCYFPESDDFIDLPKDNVICTLSEKQPFLVEPKETEYHSLPHEKRTSKSLNQIFTDGFEEFVPKERINYSQSINVSMENYEAFDEGVVGTENTELNACSLPQEINSSSTINDDTSLTVTCPSNSLMSPSKSWADIVSAWENEENKEVSSNSENVCQLPPNGREGNNNNEKTSQLSPNDSVFKTVDVKIFVDTVVDNENYEPKNTLGLTDADGFIEIISKKEMRKRRSRSKSRSEAESSDTKNIQNDVISEKKQMSSDKSTQDLMSNSETNGVDTCNLKEPIHQILGHKDIKNKWNEESLQKCISLDNSFWIDKWKFHESECQWQKLLAQSSKKIFLENSVDLKGPMDSEDGGDDDKGGSSGPSSPGPRVPHENVDSRNLDYNTELLSADLPGGICSWTDESTYLSMEEHTSRLVQRVAEEVFNGMDEDCQLFPYLEMDDQLLQLKESLVTDLDILQKNLDETEKDLSCLPSDTLMEMSSALIKIQNELEDKEHEAIRLESILQELPQDSDSQTLGMTLSVITNRIQALLSHTEHNRSTVEDAVKEQEKRQEEVIKYQLFLRELEMWLAKVNTILMLDIKFTATELTQDYISNHQDLAQELILHKNRLYQITQICTQLQDYSDVNHLAVVLLQQLVHVSEELKDIEEQLNHRLALLQDSQIAGELREAPALQDQKPAISVSPVVFVPPVESVDKPIPHPELDDFVVVSTLETSPVNVNEVVSDVESAQGKVQIIQKHTDDTIASSASSIPDDSIHITNEIFIDEPEKPNTSFHVASQTGNSLLASIPSEAVISKIITKDQGIDCHVPVNTEVQTEWSSDQLQTFGSEQINQDVLKDHVPRDKIKISQLVGKNEEMIEISTKKGNETSKTDDLLDPKTKKLANLTDSDLTVHLKYKDKPEQDDSNICYTSSELNITHTMPQSFETVVVDPGECVTEVVVDAEGNKKIIVRKTRRTVVTRKEDVVQKEFTMGGTSDDKDLPEKHFTAASGDTQDDLPLTQIANQPKVTLQEYTTQNITNIPGDDEGSFDPQQLYKIIPGSNVQTIVHQVQRKVIHKRRRIIRKVVIIDGKEHITEEVIEEPEEIEISGETIPRVSIEILSNEDGSDVFNLPKNILNEENISSKEFHDIKASTESFLNLEKATLIGELEKSASHDAVETDKNTVNAAKGTEESLLYQALEPLSNDPNKIIDIESPESAQHYASETLQSHKAVLNNGKPEELSVSDLTSKNQLSISNKIENLYVDVIDADIKSPAETSHVLPLDEKESYLSQPLKDDTICKADIITTTLDEGRINTKEESEKPHESIPETPEDLLPRPEVLPYRTSFAKNTEELIESESAETSLAESTEIVISASDSTETTKPTEQEIVFLNTSEISPICTHTDATHDVGYDPEDKTTLDESSLVEDEKKIKKRKKKRQKFKSKSHEPSETHYNQPKEKDDVKYSIELTKTVMEQDNLKDEPDASERKGIKRKRGKKDEDDLFLQNDDTFEPEILRSVGEKENVKDESSLENRDALPSPRTLQLEIINDGNISKCVPFDDINQIQKEYNEIYKNVIRDDNIDSCTQTSRNSEPITVEEFVQTVSPQTPAFELGIIEETLKKDVIDSDQKLTTTDNYTQASVETVPVVEEAVQTISPEVSKIKTSEFSHQTAKDELTPTAECMIQTSPEMELINVTETSMQTISEMATTHEQEMQTVTPELQVDLTVETTDISIQTLKHELNPVQDDSMQTISPETPIVPDLVEACIQTTTEEPIITEEESVQTVTPEGTSLETEEKLVQTYPDNLHESVQTTDLHVDTTETSSQTNKEDGKPMQDELIQTLTSQISEIASIETLESSVQTIETRTLPAIEGSTQTITPDLPTLKTVETTECCIQTKPEELNPTQESTIQTSPVLINDLLSVNSAINVESKDESLQTITQEVNSCFTQTVKCEPHLLEESVQTITPEAIITSTVLTQTAATDLTPMSEQSVFEALTSQNDFNTKEKLENEEISVPSESSSINISDVSLMSNKDTPPTFEQILEDIQSEKIEEIERESEPCSSHNICEDTNEDDSPKHLFGLQQEIKLPELLPVHNENVQMTNISSDHIKGESKNSGMQTNPVLIHDINEERSSSSDSPFEVHIHASITYSQANEHPITELINVNGNDEITKNVTIISQTADGMTGTKLEKNSKDFDENLAKQTKQKHKDKEHTNKSDNEEAISPEKSVIDCISENTSLTKLDDHFPLTAHNEPKTQLPITSSSSDNTVSESSESVCHNLPESVIVESTSKEIKPILATDDAKKKTKRHSKKKDVHRKNVRKETDFTSVSTDPVIGSIVDEVDINIGGVQSFILAEKSITTPMSDGMQPSVHSSVAFIKSDLVDIDESQDNQEKNNQTKKVSEIPSVNVEDHVPQQCDNLASANLISDLHLKFNEDSEIITSSSLPAEMNLAEETIVNINPSEINLTTEIEDKCLIYSPRTTDEALKSPDERTFYPDEKSGSLILYPDDPSNTAADIEKLIYEEQKESSTPHHKIAIISEDAKWRKTSNIVVERVKNLQNARRTTHLSGVLCLASLHQVIPEESVEQKNVALQENLNKLRSAAQNRDVIVIQSTVITTIETISTWLETVEYRVFFSRQQQANSTPTPEQIKTQFGSIKEEISTIEKNVDALGNILEATNDICNEDDKAHMKQCVLSLHEQVKAIEEVTQESEQQATRDLSRWEEFLNAVNNVGVLVDDLRQQLEELSEAELPAHDKLQQLEEIEIANHQHQDQSVQLLATARMLLREFPGREIPTETYATHEATRLIALGVTAERERLLQQLALADEYEQTLREFAQITDVADALVDSPVTVQDLNHLQEEMQKHRKFFVNLSHCRGILESLEGNLDAETRAQHQGLHQRLHRRATVILDKAASRAQQMALAASRWTVLEQGMREEHDWLQLAQQRLPDLHATTSSDYDQYISLFQSLLSEVTIHQARVTQLVDSAQRLEDLVNCIGLKSRYDEPLGGILCLQDDVATNLRRLLTFHDAWCSYDTLASKLELWIKSTDKDLENISPGGNMRHFWELKAQLELHSGLRNEAGTNFDMAMATLPVADETLQRQLHAQLEERWHTLSDRMANIQNDVTRSLADESVPLGDRLCALERELQELRSSIDGINGVLRSSEELDLYIERLQVMRQRLDHIQDELGRLGLLSTEQSDVVGSLLGGARSLELQVSEELEAAEVVRAQLRSVKKGLSQATKGQEFVRDQLDQCEAAQGQGSEAVAEAVGKCRGAGTHLANQWQELMILRQQLHSLPTTRLRLSLSPLGVERRMSALQDGHDSLEVRHTQLMALLTARLGLWKQFEHRLEAVQQQVSEAGYMMELLTVQGSLDLDRLVKASERLQGLSGSLEEREQLLTELRAAAEPLSGSCAPEVSRQIADAVQEAVASWHETRRSLQDLCTRYGDAVALWRQYRDASDAVRAWADQQLEAAARLSVDLTPELVQASELGLRAHQGRLDELRELAARVAEAAGVEAGAVPLGAELTALGRRLQEVQGALSQLAEAAETRAAGRHEIQATRAFLASVQQSLAVVEEATEQDTENQLGALRNHLLALGKTEGQLKQLRDRNAEILTTSAVDDTSVVEVLALWQQVFRETFQQYHRLSARLVRGQDGAAALRLWQEYLLHVQAFLSASIPGEYAALTEHQHLCEVHQNLLTSQQSVLLSKSDNTTSHLGGGLVEESVAEQFASLTNLHNETLSKIMDRHAEVRDRLARWDKYRQEQAVLLAWLRDTEKERASLQLRYIHLRLLPKVLLHIQSLLERLPSGEEQAESLYEQHSKLLQFCDPALAASIRMEHAAISQRISNLQAGLETWKVFLDRIIGLFSTYEQQATALQSSFADIQKSIDQCSALPNSHRGMQSQLKQLRELQKQVADQTTDLESIGITVEQLKECASPHDIKTVSQRIWLLWQAQADLEHQLSLKCHQLEERLGLRILFDTRQARFLVWAAEIEARLERAQMGSPEEVLRHLETEVQAEVSLKSREADWLIQSGQELLQAEDSEDNSLHEKVEQLQNCWEKLQGLGRARAAKLNELLLTMSQLELRLTELRAWLHNIESQLASPLVFETCSKEVVDRKIKEHEELQKIIEKQSGNVGDVLNLCELLLSNCEACKATINTESISAATDILEQRWKTVCSLSAERKRRIMSIWQLLQDLIKLSQEQEDWLCVQERVLEDIRNNSNVGSQSKIQSQISEVEGVLKEVDSHSPALRILDQSYSRLHKESWLEPDNLRQLTAPVRDLLQRWHNLTPDCNIILQKLLSDLQVYRDFLAIHGQAFESLTKLHVHLTEIQYLSEKPNEDQIKKLLINLTTLEPMVLKVEEAGKCVLEQCQKEEETVIRLMQEECQNLYKDMESQIKQLQHHGSGLSVDSSVQVETLRFEQDSAIQVDTLRLTSQDAYRYELDEALRECNTNLDQLEIAIGDSRATGPLLAKSVASARSSVELIRHLNSLLLEHGRTEEVSAMSDRFTSLLARAQSKEQSERELSESSRLTCPLCSRRNWQQLDNDLWRLEQWLQFAEGTQSTQSSPPSNIEQLEDTIQDHREFLMDLDSHKSIVVSLNIVGSHLADHTEDSSKADQLRSRLATTNSRWDAVCRSAGAWQTQLQTALMENHEFHQIIEELVEWLEKTENVIRQTEPVDLADDSAVIEAKYNKFRELRSDLERCEPRVMSLQDAADQLLRQSEAEPGSSTWSRLTELRLRLQSLRRLTGVYVLKLGAVLGRDPSEIWTPINSTAATSMLSLPRLHLEPSTSSQVDIFQGGDQKQPNEAEDVDRSVLARGYRFLGRVVRASLPIQAIMLLLLGVASLVPTAEEDYSCNLSNTFGMGLEPMLRYQNGPPPI